MSDTGQSAKDRILDTAEELFSKQSHETVSFREIAAKANVHVSQIIYHFKNKHDLLGSVVSRRADELNRERLEMLNYYVRAVGTDKLEVEAILRAFLDPFFKRRMGGDPGWKHYSALIGRIVWNPSASEYINQAFNSVAKAYIDALGKALPDADEEHIHWAFQFVLAAMYSAEETNSRVAHLSEQKFSGKDLSKAYELILPFLVAGFNNIPRSK